MDDVWTGEEEDEKAAAADDTYDRETREPARQAPARQAPARQQNRRQPAKAQVIERKPTGRVPITDPVVTTNYSALPSPTAPARNVAGPSAADVKLDNLKVFDKKQGGFLTKIIKVPGMEPRSVKDGDISFMLLPDENAILLRCTKFENEDAEFDDSALTSFTVKLAGLEEAASLTPAMCISPSRSGKNRVHVAWKIGPRQSTGTSWNAINCVNSFSVSG